jgi:hypothetical protein
MFKKSLLSQMLAATLFTVACGGPEEELGQLEPQEPTEMPHALGAESARKDQPSTQDFAVLPPGYKQGFPSWWIGYTDVVVQGYGGNFQGTPVHMYCTTGKNDAYFWLNPGEVKNFRWACGGRTIWVTNQGNTYNQDIQVTTY